MGDYEALTRLETTATSPHSSMMVISKCGVLWLIDFEESGTLRISSTHASEKAIKLCRFIPQLK